MQLTNKQLLKHLPGLRWVGKLSLQDADILAGLAKQSNSILETGAGGSTLIFAQCTNHIVSIESDQRWINLTQERLTHLGLQDRVTFHTDIEPALIQPYDMIFIDCLLNTRLQHAKKAWKFLKPGGCLLIHDTTRTYHFKIASDFIQANLLEIKHILINTLASDGNPSNMTIIYKMDEGLRELDWKLHEGKEPWTYGERNIKTNLFWEYKPNVWLS